MSDPRHERPQAQQHRRSGALFIALVAAIALAVVFYHRNDNDQASREPDRTGSVTSMQQPDSRPPPPPNS
jgi:hypothetical protein